MAKLCLTLCDPMDCSTLGSPVLHYLRSLLKFMSIELVMLSKHLILCCLLLLLPSIFPSIRVFSNESTLCIKCPKYWSFSFNSSPFNEYLGLISFVCVCVCVCVCTHLLNHFNHIQLCVTLWTVACQAPLFMALS